MSKEIYIVTAGDYSDYHILAVYDDREIADMAASQYNKGDSWYQAEVEVWPLNPNNVALRDGWSHYFIRMDREGGYTFDQAGRIFDDPEQHGFDVKGNMYISGMFKSEEHAVKSANEKRLILIAENRWGEV